MSAHRVVIERVEHTGELELRLSAPTMETLLAAALRAVADEVEEGDEAPANSLERRRLAIDASGPDTLLADLLNEAIFLMETEGFLPTGLEARELEGGRLRGVLVGRCADAPRPLVKAATYHRLGVWREGDGWRGTVVLDV
jgi:SHS2 domain-containing protein